jgi:sulfate transporter 4
MSLPLGTHPRCCEQVSKKDFIVWIVAFFGTLFLGVELGLAISIGLALLLVIYESAFPHTAILGRIPGTTVYRNTKQYHETEIFSNILLFRIDAPIYFANITFIRDQLSKVIRKAQEVEPVHYVILELSPVTHIDASGLQGVSDIIRDLRKDDIQLALANPSAYVAKKLELENVPENLGREWIFVRMHDAVQYVQVGSPLPAAPTSLCPTAAQVLGALLVTRSLYYLGHLLVTLSLTT